MAVFKVANPKLFDAHPELGMGYHVVDLVPGDGRMRSSRCVTAEAGFAKRRTHDRHR
jgi:hypothetical protein